MGSFSVVLGMLVGGYCLGIWTARRVLRERQGAYEDGRLEQGLQPSPRPIPAIEWTLDPSR
jgi:hypothetical protein